MATNTLKTRIKHKIGSASDWQTAATNSQFKPLDGELIIYKDATTPRLKVGYDSKLVTELPFIDGIKLTVNGSGNAITAASYDENTRTLTLTKGASYTNNTGDITGVTAGNGLTGGATSGTATLNVGAGAGITVTDDAVGHTNSVTADTASEGGSARTLAFGGSFNIPSVTYDAQGHITGKGSIALKLPAKPTYTDTNTTYDLAAAKSKVNGSVTLDLTAGGSGSGTDSVTIKGTGATTVTTDANGVITINSTDTNTQAVSSVNSKTGAVSLTYSDVGAAASSHNHSASNITSGTLDAARLPNISIDKLVAGTTNTTIPSSLLPSYVDDVLEYTAKSNFPSTGATGKIYVDKTTNLTYRWSGSAYVEISPSLALGSTSSTAYRGDYGAAAYKHGVTNKGSEFSSGLYKIATNSEGHVTAATAVTKSDITGLGIPGQDTTYSTFVKSGSGAKAGLVPAPSTTAGTTKYLREDGTWAVPPDTNTIYTLPTASSSTLGGVKTTSTVTSTSGLTACPIISGVPYYKDTNTTYSLSSFGITATAAELNVLDGITATTAELNYCDGVTSNIQTQLNNKAASSHTHYYAGSDSIGGRAHQAQALTNGSQSYASCYYDDSNSSTTLQMSNSSGPQYAFQCRAGTTDLYIHHYNTNGSWNSGWRIWRAGDSVTGAVWNDYAEYRESNCEEPGRVLIENGDDTLSVASERLQPFAGIVSDTWGFCQGETEKAKTPIAVAGRVLAYPYRNRDEYKPGDCVCAAPNGTVDIMTREEVMMYPDRIVGTVSCIPDYEEWGQGDRPAAKVDGRIWIKVK